MKKRLFLLIAVSLVLVGSAFGANCGGSIQCNCGDTLISSQTMWYDLTNCGGTGINIGANGVTLDCANYSISGSGNIGISSSSRNSFTVKNCIVQNFRYGIFLRSSSGNNISNNIVSSNDWNILFYDSSDFNLVFENYITYSANSGVYIDYGNNNRITENKIMRNGQGVFINGALNYNNIFWANKFEDNAVNAYEEFGVSGTLWNNTVVGNNWSDFSTNPGYPSYYAITGPGNGIDWLPNRLTIYILPIGNRVILENQTLTIDVDAFTLDNFSLSFDTNAYQVLPSPFSFDSSTGIFQWMPTFSDAGFYNVTFNVTDGINSDSETITITVINADRAPVLDFIGDKQVNENEILTIHLNASDPDGDTLTFSTNAASVLPSPFSFTPTTGVFQWTPTYRDSGVYPLIFNVSDGTLNDAETITLTVVDTIVFPPELYPIGNREVTEDQPLLFRINASDPDSTTFTYYTNAGSVLPSAFSFNSVTGIFNWTPMYYDQGNYQVNFNVTDGVLWDEETITITVDNVPYTDLVISQEDILFSDDTPYKRDPVTITTFFHNPLEIDPASVLVRFYNGVPSTETFIGESTIEIGLLASDFFAQIEWIPSMEGNYDIYTVLDPLQSIPEAREDNNQAFKAITVLTKPDVRIRDSDVAFSNNYPTQGDTIQVLAMVRNIESLPTGTFTIRVYDGNWANLIGETTLSLDPLQTRTISVPWNIGAYGDHQVHVYGDSRFIVNELNETNNHGQRSIHINRAPIMQPIENQSTYEDRVLTINVQALDPDMDTVTYATNADQILPSSFSFDEDTGVFSWRPTYRDAGTYRVTFSASDDYTIINQEISITVQDVVQPGGGSPIMSKKIAPIEPN